MSFEHRKNFLTKLTAKNWFPLVQLTLPKLTFPKATPNPDVVLALKAESENLLDSETKLYQKLREIQKNKDIVWAKKILLAGTLSDKISAHTMIIQDSHVYNLKSLETLIGMVNTKGKRECLMAMDTLLELFIGDLLLEDRKLRLFSEQPLNIWMK
ncbi:hypothetical protein TNCT_562341 [Trichonephila clavata]|uniref:Uncharacterized protein n=1 Tax=Trichonephila clavata TaxID=2740835 RepID=A0A8X6LMA1_TRICU|nr:hypothetical protein TNCT_562341 [Trichonephila clavata]